ncbi:MAG TPA: ABC transporter permease [Candidatus Binataceae bacterium]|nr:ABC transporter permease [Candidatus Binataceae bacterium]
MLSAIGKSIAALALAGAIIAAVVAVLGASPIGVFAALWEGAFGSWYAAADTIVKATPLIFTGLAVAVAFSGALWNIGADGQLLAGAIAAGAIGPYLGGWPRPAAIILMLCAGAIGGAIWGGICGWLRARRDTNEVISTIMMNFVAAQLLSWVVHGPLIEASGAYPQSMAIAPSARMYLPLEPTRLNPAIVLAIVLALGCYLLLFHSRAGFELRAMGRNRRAAAFHRIPIARLTIAVLALSGALAGIGGAVQVSAITHRLYEKFSPGWGFEAIAVALVARLNPFGIIAAAIFFGALDNGSQAMQRIQGVSPVLVQVIQGLVIMILLAFDTPAWARIRGSLFARARDSAPPIEPGAQADA